MNLAFSFVLAALAVWRLTHLIVNEDGPANLIARLRLRLERGFCARLVTCFECASMWISAPIAALVAPRALDWPLLWLAISGAACLLERLGTPPASVFEEDELLRTETSGREDAEPVGRR